jgi:hypothetical protein
MERTEKESFKPGFATVISLVSNPLFVAIPTFLIIALYTASSLLQACIWWGITVVGISLAPLLFIRRGVRRGLYSDHHVSIRQERLVPLSFGIACFFGVFVSLILLQASATMLATITAALVSLIVATGVTRFWTKISLHLVGIAGTATVFTLLFGTVAGIVYPLVFIVAWARWRVRAHTVFQAFFGTVLAVSVTLLTFWLFGLL